MCVGSGSQTIKEQKKNPAPVGVWGCAIPFIISRTVAGSLGVLWFEPLPTHQREQEQATGGRVPRAFFGSGSRELAQVPRPHLLN